MRKTRFELTEYVNVDTGEVFRGQKRLHRWSEEEGAKLRTIRREVSREETEDTTWVKTRVYFKVEGIQLKIKTETK